MLVNGNYSKLEAEDLAQAVAGRMVLNTEDKLIPSPLVYQLPNDKLRFKTLNTTDKNHALALYIQNNDASIDAMAKAFVLSKLLMTPMYQALRVEKQIGYALGVSLSLQQRVAGLVFYVQSPNYTPDKIYEALQTFWQGYAPTIAQLQTEDLKSVQASLFNELMGPPKTLNEQSIRLWPTIEIGRNDFDLRQKIAQSIEKLTVADVQAYYQSLILDNKAGKVAVVSKMTQIPTEWQALDDWQVLKEKVKTFNF
jgi:secreted Zn-dependent insulinase-like peptidase